MDKLNLTEEQIETLREKYSQTIEQVLLNENINLVENKVKKFCWLNLPFIALEIVVWKVVITIFPDFFAYLQAITDAANRGNEVIRGFGLVDVMVLLGIGIAFIASPFIIRGWIKNSGYYEAKNYETKIVKSSKKKKIFSKMKSKSNIIFSDFARFINDLNSTFINSENIQSMPDFWFLDKLVYNLKILPYSSLKETKVLTIEQFGFIKNVLCELLNEAQMYDKQNRELSENSELEEMNPYVSQENISRMQNPQPSIFEYATPYPNDSYFHNTQQVLDQQEDQYISYGIPYQEQSLYDYGTSVSENPFKIPEHIVEQLSNLKRPSRINIRYINQDIPNQAIVNRTGISGQSFDNSGIKHNKKTR